MKVDPVYEQQIRTLTRNGQLVISKHARKRLNERKIAISDAKEAIINGGCVYQEPPGVDRAGIEYKEYRLHFIGQGHSFTVIVTAGIPPVLVTAILD